MFAVGIAKASSPKFYLETSFIQAKKSFTSIIGMGSHFWVRFVDS